MHSRNSQIKAGKQDTIANNPSGGYRLKVPYNTRGGGARAGAAQGRISVGEGSKPGLKAQQ